jgi:DNA-directed RNA polymerase specialized sigma24 family protein
MATTGMTDFERDRLIWTLRLRRHSYAKIARYVGVSVGAVRHSLARTAAKLGQGVSSDWNADLR